MSSDGPTPVVTEPVPTYAELLAAADLKRRAADDLLVNRMMQPRAPMNPDSGSWGGRTD
jgi:hypothetical protein